VTALVLVFLLMLLFKSSALAPLADLSQSTSIALGFILVFAFLAGNQLKRLRLPQITGFILAGILCGPYVAGFISRADTQNLQLLDGLALSLIALTAGGEMRVEKLRRRFRSISWIALLQTLFILCGFVLLGWLGRSLVPFFEGWSLAHVFAFSLLLGTLSTPTSPATTIAVITETRSAGKVTDLVLETAVVKDFLVIMIFAFTLSLSRSLTSGSSALDPGFLLRILGEVGGSVLSGIILGAGITLYLKFIRRDITVFVLGAAFFSYQISHNYGFHPLLICLVAGFLVENFSAQGKFLISAIEKSSMPIYVVFFTISGASLNLLALRRAWVLALVCVAWRGALKFAGTFIGAGLGREDEEIRRLAWTGFVSQAGVALGMAIIVQKTFPQWGETFMALVLAVIAINQVVGPVFFQKLLIRMKEAGKKVPAGRG